ncbi:MFS transporter [Plantibacter flavus]|uniref:MFS transporter n=1 Tax=Plantibacter flavus TaxID=150123 RepID=UPI003F17DAA3
MMTAPTTIGARPFRSLVQRAGPAYFLVEFLAKLPLAMTLVGVLTVVTVYRGSIAEAGIVSGVLGLASGLGAPLIGLAADRWGQRRLLFPIVIVNGVALLVFLAAVVAGVPAWILLLLSVAIGTTSPQIGAMGRARWIGMLKLDRSGRQLDAAMSWESMTDEVSFIVGPLLVAMLTTLIHPAAPLIGAAAIVLTFAGGFALHPLQASARTGSDGPVGSFDEATRPLMLVVLGMALVGMFWGVSLTSVTALSDEAGVPGAGGLIYGAMGITASATALAAGWIPARVSLAMRWVGGAGVAVLLSLPLLVVHGPVWVGLVYFGIGMGVGPVLVTLFTVAARLAPIGRKTTVMTIVGSGSILGQSLGTGVNGLVVQQYGAAAGLALAVGLLVLLALTGAVHMYQERASAARQQHRSREP